MKTTFILLCVMVVACETSTPRTEVSRDVQAPAPAHDALTYGSACTNSSECKGVLNCSDGICSCPAGYSARSGGAECVVIPAQNNVKSNHTSDDVHRVMYGNPYMKGDDMCTMFHYSDNLYANPWEFCMNVHNKCHTVCPDGNSGSWLCSHGCPNE